MSLTKVTYSMIDGTPVNVKDFGAKGDGVTDDHAAILAAINYISSFPDSQPVELYFPPGVYSVRSFIENPDTTGVVCFIITKSNFTIRGAGVNSTKIVYSRDSDSSGARFIDIFNCSNWYFGDMSVESANIPGAGAALERVVNGRNNQKFTIKNVYVKNISRYAFGHQQGPFIDGLWENLWIDWTGNDGIDVKDSDGGSLPAGNKGLIINNIYGINFGMLTNNAPNSLIDVRGPAIINNIYALNIQNQSQIIRCNPIGTSGLPPNTGSQRTLINNVWGKGTSKISGDNQQGLVISCENVVISNIYLEELFVGVNANQSSFSEGGGVLSDFVIKNCDTGVLATTNDYSISSGNFVDCDKGVTINDDVYLSNLFFDNCTRPFDVSSAAGGTKIVNCKSVNSSFAVVASEVRSQVLSVGNTGFGGQVEACGFPSKQVFYGGVELRDSDSAVKGAVVSVGDDIELRSGSGSTTRVLLRADQYIESRINGVNITRLAPNFFRPSADNSLSLGDPGQRWTEVFAVNGTINTSDARQKQQVRALSEQEQAVAIRCKSLLRAFKWNDAIQKKGDGARVHFGVIAQDLADAFRAEGLDPDQYSMFCYDKWDAEYEPETAIREVQCVDKDGTIYTKKEEYQTGNQVLVREAGDSYGVRYNELLAFVVAAL